MTTGRATAGLHALRGRWLRPDGGYILDYFQAALQQRFDVVFVRMQ
jgi:hypothetical protein